MAEVGLLATGDTRGALEATDALALALHADPGWSEVVPDADARRRVQTAVLRASVADAVVHGQVLVARAEGRVVGAAVWLRPGAYPLAKARKVRLVARLLPAAVRDPRAMQRAAALGDAVDLAFPGPHVGYLEALGVRPQDAGQGLGRALLAYVPDEGEGTYLETSKEANVGFYESAGFSVLAGSPAPIGPGLPVMWRMLRSAG